MKYKIFLEKGGIKIIQGDLKVYENQVVITDIKGNIHAYKNYNNIEPLEEKKDIDSFKDLP